MSNVVFSGEYAVIAQQNSVEKDYWLENLEGLEGAKFSRDFKESDRLWSPENIKQVEFRFQESASAEAIRICRQSDHKLYTLLTSVVAVLLHKYNGHFKFVIASGLPAQDESEGYGNTWLPLVIGIPEKGTFKDLLFDVTKSVSNTLAQQNFPIGYVVNDLYSKNLKCTPFNDVESLSLNIHNDNIPDHSNMSFRFRRDENEMRCVIRYKASLYEEATVNRIAADYQDLLYTVLANASISLADIAIENYKFSCAIIGESSIALKCAEMLLEKNHNIVSMITSDPQIIPEAKNLGLKVIHYENEQQVRSHLELEKIDYLFSVNNPIILSSGILSIPRKSTINYHDSLLPAYAGRNATAWAILNNEKEHGITWHRADASVDTGDILAQSIVSIDHDDTSFSLNLKCYRAALIAFNELLSGLQSRSLEPVPQAPVQRSYYGKHDKPFGAGIISFDDTAENISAKVRALNFGAGYNNILASPKVMVAGGPYIPGTAEVLTTRSGLAPGTLLSIDNSKLQIATQTNDIELDDFSDLDGKHPHFHELNLTLGMSLSISGKMLADVDRISKIIARKESFWRQEFSKFMPVDFSSIVPKPGDLYGQASEDPSSDVLDLNHLDFSGDDLLLLFGAFLLRISGTGSVGLWYHDQNLRDIAIGYDGLFSAFVPLNVSSQREWPAEEFLNHARRSLSLVREASTFTTDIFLRYPGLQRPASQIVDLILTDQPLERFSAIGSGLSFIFNAHSKKAMINGLQAKELSNQFQNFLNNLRATPATTLVSIPVLSAEQQQQILAGFNDTAAPVDVQATLHGLFEQSVLRHGDKVAIAFHDEQLTYEQLNNLSNKLAHLLRRDGVGRSVPVGIVASRSPEMIVGIIATLKAGGTYVPIDSEQPFNRMRSILESVNTAHVITFGLEGIEDLRSGARCLKFLYSLDKLDLSQESDENPLPVSGPNDVAYVIHTSGSTGKPKGVVVRHRAVINTIQWVNDRFNVSRDDTLMFITSIGFDLSVYDIFGMLAVGGTIRVIGKEEIRQPALLAEYITRYNITFWDSTPGTLQQVSYFLNKENVKNNKLRIIFLSGDWIPMTLIPKLKNVFDNTTIVSLGGATEASIWSNYFVVEELASNWVSVPYGKPIRNAKYFIFDQFMNVCPTGVEGDLYIGGQCLADGYLNEAELTANRFIANPYEPGELIYRTGDRARYFNDGNIEFLGRVDRQVKVRGFRVELGEVEKVMSRFAGIKHVVVLAKTYADNDRRLIGYFTSHHPIAKESLRAFIQENLPDYMVPSKLINVAAIPLTAVGKVDFNLLQLTTDPDEDMENTSDLPESDLEKKIAAIWEKVLDRQKIKLTDNFFDLGGHSFLVIKVSLAMKDEFGKEPRFIDFVKTPLAEFVSNYSRDLSNNL